MLGIEKKIDDCNQICLKMRNNLGQINNDVESIRQSIEMRQMESMPDDLDSIGTAIIIIRKLYKELLEL